MKPRFRAVVLRKGGIQQTADAGLADLRAALKIPEGRDSDLLKKYVTLREAVREYSESMTAWKEQYTPEEREEEKDSMPVLPDVVVPDGLPKEFALYIQGAVQYHKGDMRGAVKKWNELSRLPEKERQYRGMWAAFMTGKAHMKSNPDRAVKWFVHVRKLAGAGFVDTLGLAAASYGWEARTELSRKNYTRAIELYMAQYAGGDYSAIISLRITAGRVLKDNDDAILSVARHKAGSLVINAHLVSDTGSTRGWLGGKRKELCAKWLKAIDAAGVKDVPGADRLAWIAYQAGDFKAAACWLKKAPRNAPAAQWIRAKLLLRDGKLDEAAAALADVVRVMPENSDDYHYRPDYFYSDNPNHPVRGELAVLRMARGQYAEAMDLLIRGDFWIDAAYVAERVLTPEELIAYVDRHWPQSTEKQFQEERMHIRHLLARRLARLKRYKQARPYYSAEDRKVFDKYVTSLKQGRDMRRSRAERAKSLWEAAKTARKHGMELLGTEVEPDWHFYKGHYENEPLKKSRAKAAGNKKIVLVTSDEKKRWNKNKIDIEKRFHYRYVAAKLGWDAAELMPDESDETARVLCEAGTWLKDRDTKAADRFYKALVNRCRSTVLGKEADRLRWFPKLENRKP
jgi:tetratricopeptide (TPR) repeat protein